MNGEAMANYINYDYDQMMMVPVCLNEQLQPGTLEFAIHFLVEKHIDMSVFEQRFKNDDTGRPAYDPKILLKVILLGYSRGIATSRKIEGACRENIIFLSLCCGRVPDYSTIANFVSSMTKEALKIFQDVLTVCMQQGLLGGTCFALDGCKLPSNASKNWSGTIKELQLKKRRLEKKLARMIHDHKRKDAKEQTAKEQKANKIKIEKSDEKIQELKRTVEKIEKWLNKAEPKAGQKKHELKSNIIDNDSAKMVTSHGTIQGYNAQALVDSKNQIIVHAQAIGKATDSEMMPPMLEAAKTSMKAIGESDDYFKNKQLLADNAYYSETNLKACATDAIDVYIPDSNFRSRYPRMPLEKLTEKKFSLVDFQIDCDKKVCICPAGKQLTYSGKRRDRQTNYHVFIAAEEACMTCHLRTQCIQSDKTKRKNVFVYFDPQAREMSLKLQTKFNQKMHRDIYYKRMEIVEPVFANIREQKGLDRFTLRGEKKVNVQWILYCLVHNIEKIANFAPQFALS